MTPDLSLPSRTITTGRLERPSRSIAMFGRVAQRVARSSMRAVTPVGRGVIVLSVACAFLWWALAWEELLTLAVGTGLVALVGLATLSGTLRLTVERSLPSDRVCVGDRLVARLVVGNPSRRSVGRRDAVDSIGSQRLPVTVPPLKGRSEHTAAYVVPTDRRGRYALGPLRVVRSDPFGLFRRERLLGGEHELYVLPRVHPISLPSRSWTSDLDGPTHDSSPNGGNIFHTLRDYQLGDDVRHVHWRTTARVGRLVVRQYVDSRRPSALVLFDNRSASYADDETYELAIEFAASIAMAFVRTGREVIVHTSGGELGGRNAAGLGARLLDRFAVLTPDPSPDSTALEAAARSAKGAVTETVLVTGGLVAGLPELVAGLPGTRPIVLRVHDGEGINLPGCRVLDLTDSEEFVSRWNAGIR